VPNGAAQARQFEIGSYTCPDTGLQVPLLSNEPLQLVHWPVTVKQCAACGELHVVHREDIVHPPVYGYE
jgi:hypothetical protein